MSSLRFTPDPAAIVDPALKEWADERVRAYIDAINLHGGYRAAGRVLGHSHAARHGYQSVRQTMAETYSKRFGKASEIIVTPEMLT